MELTPEERRHIIMTAQHTPQQLDQVVTEIVVTRLGVALASSLPKAPCNHKPVFLKLGEISGPDAVLFEHKVWGYKCAECNTVLRPKQGAEHFEEVM